MDDKVARTIQVTAVLIQLGEEDVWPSAPQAELKLTAMPSSTVVVAVEVLKAEAGDKWPNPQPQDMKHIKEVMSRWLPKPTPEPSLYDVFSVKRSSETLDFLMRIPSKMLNAVLEKSAVDGMVCTRALRVSISPTTPCIGFPNRLGGLHMLRR